MSTKDPDDGLTDKQREVFDHADSICASGLDGLSFQMQQGCVYHQLAINDLKARKQNAHDKLVENTRRRETNTVNDWHNRWDAQAIALLASFVDASSAYE